MTSCTSLSLCSRVGRSRNSPKHNIFLRSRTYLYLYLSLVRDLEESNMSLNTYRRVQPFSTIFGRGQVAPRSKNCKCCRFQTTTIGDLRFLTRRNSIEKTNIRLTRPWRMTCQYCNTAWLKKRNHTSLSRYCFLYITARWIKCCIQLFEGWCCLSVSFTLF